MLAGKYSDPNIVQIKSMGRKPSLFADFSTFLKIRKIIKNLVPQIVHTHTSKAGVLGRLAAISLRRKIKIVHSYHGHHLYGYFPKTIVKVIVLTEKCLAFLTHLLIADSEQVMIDLQKAKIGSKDKWQVIPPGIRKSESITKETARLKIGTEKDLFLITWIGRFTEIKDPFLALEALKQLQKLDNSKFSMIMIGDGELLDTCKEFSEKNQLGVIFPGWQSNVTSYLAAADILLVTSKNEGFGMVIAEAGLQNVPAVSTNVGGVAEFIKDQRTGILIPNDATVIARTILGLAKSGEQLVILGLMARKTALEKFIIEIFVNNHKIAYKNLLS
jgi:glycosyltransferase involved in cell wall biosynthesis